MLIVASIAAAWIFRGRLFAVFSSADRVRAAVEGAGAWSVVAFIALQVVQVVVFIIPGEFVQIAGGWIFGAALGSLYSSLGIALGSMFNFALARLFGRRFVAALFGLKALDRFDCIVRSRRAAGAFFLLFAIPGLPKDALCFVAGLSGMRPLAFAAVSMLGRLPGIVGSSIMGQAVSDGRYGLLAAIAVGAAALFLLGAVFKDRLHDAVSASARGELNGEPERLREEA